MPLNIPSVEQKHSMPIPSLFYKLWLFLLKSFICGYFQNLASHIKNCPLKQLRPLEYMLVLLKFVTSSIQQALDQVTVVQLVMNFLTFYWQLFLVPYFTRADQWPIVRVGWTKLTLLRLISYTSVMLPHFLRDLFICVFGNKKICRGQRLCYSIKSCRGNWRCQTLFIGLDR